MKNSEDDKTNRQITDDGILAGVVSCMITHYIFVARISSLHGDAMLAPSFCSASEKKQ